METKYLYFLFCFCRYLFSLQMKRDLMEGRMICTENTGALLASHFVQCMFKLLFTTIFGHLVILVKFVNITHIQAVCVSLYSFDLEHKTDKANKDSGFKKKFSVSVKRNICVRIINKTFT